MKVIFHAAELASCKKVFNNVKNLLQASESPIHIAILFNSDAILSLKLQTHTSQNTEMLAWATFIDDVELLACQNSMRGFDLTESDLIGNVKTVKSGVLTLIERQTAGFTYIRP